MALPFTKVSGDHVLLVPCTTYDELMDTFVYIIKFCNIVDVHLYHVITMDDIQILYERYRERTVLYLKEHCSISVTYLDSPVHRHFKLAEISYKELTTGEKAVADPFEAIQIALDKLETKIK